MELAWKIGVNELTLVNWEIKGMVPRIKNLRERLIQEVEGAGRLEECLTDNIQQSKRIIQFSQPRPPEAFLPLHALSHSLNSELGPSLHKRPWVNPAEGGTSEGDRFDILLR